MIDKLREREKERERVKNVWKDCDKLIDKSEYASECEIDC